MEVQICNTTTVTVPLPEPVELPLTVFDRFASYIHVAVLFAFAPPTPANSAIIDALSKTLLHFPTLTGRLSRTTAHRRPCLIIGGPHSGVLVVESAVSSKLSDHTPLGPSPELEKLHPPWEEVPYLLQVQLNRFACGGLVVGATASHRAADGKAMSSFFVAWGKAVRGAPIDPLPDMDQSWLIPRFPLRTEFRHWGKEFIPDPSNRDGFTLHQVDVDPGMITNVLLHYSPEFIADVKLKAGLRERRTTFEALLGHVWRKITIARGLDGEAFTMVKVSVNGRPRLRPPVSNEFFGNLVLNAYPKAKAKDLVGGGVAGAARTIHDAVSEIGEGYFRSFIDFGAMNEEEELVPVYDVDGNVLSPNLEVDSWLGFRFQEVDFGCGGELCAFLPTWVPVDGLLIFLPSLRTEGGIDVVVGLMEEHATRLTKMSHTLD